jgi:hypothetical protein
MTGQKNPRLGPMIRTTRQKRELGSERSSAVRGICPHVERTGERPPIRPLQVHPRARRSIYG